MTVIAAPSPLQLRGYARSLSQLGLIITLFFIPVWFRVAGAPRPFSHNYVIGYVIFFPVAWTSFWWIVSGLPGVRSWSNRTGQLLWLGAIIGLIVWSFASQHWAFVAGNRPEVAAAGATQLSISLLFVIAVVSMRPQRRTIILTLLASAIIQSIIGGLQVATQGSIGLDWIGEFPLDPQRAGVGVVQSGDTRWLRPYGLTAHPNIYAGFLSIGLLSCVHFIFDAQLWVRRLSLITYGTLLWSFFLTFSRSAWLGFVISCAILAAIYGCQFLRQSEERRQLLAILGITIGLGVLFLALYHPLILARAGVSEEPIENRSLNDRTIYNNVAIEAIQDYPLLGVGIGNFPWYASHYLFYETDYDMRGDNVHNVYLSVQAELGLVGSVLFTIIVGGGVTIALRSKSNKTIPLERGVLLSGSIALMAIGLFDHYPWTMFHFQILFFGLLGLSLPTEVLSTGEQSQVEYNAISARKVY